MPRYEFKPLQELLWMAGVAAAVAVLQVLVTFQPDAITSWETWIVALAGGAVRAAAGALVAALTRPDFADD